jgi:hypothetical protein
VERDQRRERIAELRRQGHPYRVIAAAVGVSLGTVVRDIEESVRSGRLVQPLEVVRSDGMRVPAQWYPRGRIELPDRCPDCGELRGDGGMIVHVGGCARPRL